jgi:hypothetical protein
MFLRNIIIIAILGIMLFDAAANEQGNISDTSTGSKIFILWIGDKDSLNLPQAEVYVDGNYAGTTDSRGEVRAPINFGLHKISAISACGSAFKEYAFSEDIDGASLYINTCPNGTGSLSGSVNKTIPPRNPETSDNLTGHWAGRLYQFGGPTGNPATFKYSLDINQISNQVEGTSKIESGSYYAIMEVSGTISNDILSFTETGVAEKNEASDWYFILKKVDLNLVHTSPLVLEGTWIHSNGNAAPGSIFLMKT